jgi:hypothetical protein
VRERLANQTSNLFYLEPFFKERNVLLPINGLGIIEVAGIYEHFVPTGLIRLDDDTHSGGAVLSAGAVPVRLRGSGRG